MNIETLKAVRDANIKLLHENMINRVVFDHYGENVRVTGHNERDHRASYYGQFNCLHTFTLTNGSIIRIEEICDAYVRYQSNFDKMLQVYDRAKKGETF